MSSTLLKIGDQVKLIRIVAVPKKWIIKHTPKQINNKNIFLTATLQKAGIHINDTGLIRIIHTGLAFVEFPKQQQGVWLALESLTKIN